MLLWGFRSRGKFQSQFGIFHVFSSPFQSGENPYVVFPCGFVPYFLFTLLILIFQDLTFMFASRLMCTLKPQESLPCFETLKGLKSWGLTVFIHSGKLSFKENTLLPWKFSILMGFWAPFFSWIIQQEQKMKVSLIHICYTIVYASQNVNAGMQLYSLNTGLCKQWKTHWLCFA